MQTKTLSSEALAIMDGYINFRFGSAVCGVPYFNNKTAGSRGALRALIGKGTPLEIRDETMGVIVKLHVNKDALTNDMLKQILTDKNLGIECSGFVYHVLDAESHAAIGKPLSKRLQFVECQGMLDKIRCAMRPAENCNVRTFADERNSYRVSLSDVLPGDVITMIATENSDNPDRDHILVIHAVNLEKDKPVTIHYSHAIAYPEDGKYGTGVRQGTIQIPDTLAANSTLMDCDWKEETGNRLKEKATKSQTELRRIK